MQSVDTKYPAISKDFPYNTCISLVQREIKKKREMVCFHHALFESKLTLHNSRNHPIHLDYQKSQSVVKADQYLANEVVQVVVQVHLDMRTKIFIVTEKNSIWKKRKKL